MIDLKIGEGFEKLITWLTDNLSPIFDGLSNGISGFLGGIESFLLIFHPVILIVVFTVIAWFTAKRGIAIFTVLGFLLIWNMGFWDETIETLALVLTSVAIALIIAIPVGIWASKADIVERIVRPILDFMQTLPAFVYLIPGVILFGLGEVPAVVSTLIFSLPPTVRLTNLGIRQVPKEIKEAAQAFGSKPSQILFKAELPVALKTILAGINQTIMLSLSMVVIAAMIGAGGLGNEVLKGITQLDIGLGFESGISIVILAIFLDRVTQALGSSSQRKK
jgi:glycine betaine/proline transport system permease protein